MLVHIGNSSGTLPLGNSRGARMFMISEGIYAGRIVAVYRSSTSEIKYTYADYPYRDWSVSALVVSSSADQPFDAVLLEDNEILVAYTRSSDSAMAITRLNHVGGIWSVHSTVAVHASDDNYDPVVIQSTDGNIHLVWTRLSGGNSYVTVSESSDTGATWESPVDLSEASSEAFSSIASEAGYLHVFYILDGNSLRYRKKPLDGTSYGSEMELVSSSGLGRHFDTAVSPDGKIALTFDNGELRFMQYDGITWSGILTVSGNGGTYPQVAYFNNMPYIAFLDDLGSNMVDMKYSYLIGQSFSTPESIESGRNFFDKLQLYESSSGSYEDLTVEASSGTAGDIYHPGSLAMLAETGDVCYFGMSARFHLIRFLLGTTGIGGTVAWSYYNGRDWVNFVPSGGVWHFNDSDKTLLLWDDDESIPADWQKLEIEGDSLYWIRAAVLSPFTTPPIGSQTNAIGYGAGFILME